VDKIVARLNIEHYRKLLLSDLDNIKRATVVMLLAKEEGKLVELNRKPTKDQS
jgi:hypothetical protein